MSLFYQIHFRLYCFENRFSRFIEYELEEKAENEKINLTWMYLKFRNFICQRLLIVKTSCLFYR